MMKSHEHPEGSGNVCPDRIRDFPNNPMTGWGVETTINPTRSGGKAGFLGYDHFSS